MIISIKMMFSTTIIKRDKYQKIFVKLKYKYHEYRNANAIFRSKTS